MYLDLNFNADDKEDDHEYTKLYANDTLELAAIISEVSLCRQAIRGKHTIPRICETADKPSHTPRRNDKRPHVWDKTSGSW